MLYATGLICSPGYTLLFVWCARRIKNLRATTLSAPAATSEVGTVRGRGAHRASDGLKLI